ncbi:MAG: hypothetical protein CPDRYMAC_6508 [uncultured Paraburkholderia sp.]|nr:MAG: hypothetical protein CPDRYDRY_6433 [uncultured Paraburkholderia sp.]CAH2944586.1 MAG: hypothetical protein CPDRYMAC_6508 [uncultured Paraburkholderia sp.]
MLLHLTQDTAKMREAVMPKIELLHNDEVLDPKDSTLRTRGSLRVDGPRVVRGKSISIWMGTTLPASNTTC